jgi:GNAT superfamily N-acetyltransferase
MSDSPSSAPRFALRSAVAADVPLILDFIRQLAEYERLASAVTATEAVLRDTLFGPKPSAEVLIAESGGEPAGFAVFFHTYSTFHGRPGLYLEDLFVLPRWRRQGLGRRLLAELARIAVDRGCPRFEWSVLDWNEMALRVYRSVGAAPLDQWTVQRLEGDALQALAAEGRRATGSGT